jgi:hypothetical protein
MPSATSKPTLPINPYNPEANPLLSHPTGRLMSGFATIAHGYENTSVLSALLQFTSSLLVTQIYHPHIGRMVDKYCADLTQMVADKEAAGRALNEGALEKGRPKGKAKAKKARALRRKAASRS